MDALLSREELQYLFEKRNRFCVSIFLPTHPAGRDLRSIDQGRVQLKDLLRDAEARLASAGLQRTHLKDLLAPVGPLVEKSQFWRHQSDGLALFLAHGYFRYFQLPLQFKPFVAVADHFDITPLLPLWTSEDRFYLLALSRNRVRLFGGTHYSIGELDLKSVPRSLSEALECGVDESLRQQHTMKPGLPEDTLRYFRQIDDGLRHLLKDDHVPLALAGAEDALKLYRQVNTYPELLDEAVAGNPDKLSAEELHAAARKLVQAYYDQVRNQFIRRYQERSDAARTSWELGEILAAAHQGRVFCLFVQTDTHQWGQFDPDKGVVSGHDSPQLGDQNLVNLAVVQTILHGGSVYTLSPSEMPERSRIAALLRY
jgi:hypothetical protein